MAQTKYTNGSGVAEIWANIKNYITAQLLSKQDTLISGSNIKTVNNQSLLGSGNVSFTSLIDGKWESFNGINPGALSLPSISSSGANAWIAIDTTNWVQSRDTRTAQKYMPPADGWLNICANHATLLGLALTNGGNGMYQKYQSGVSGELALLLPVFKNKKVAILAYGTTKFAYTKVTFYPCQGNV